MKYLGSKRRIAKHIIPIIEEHRTNWWVEPFVGGGNMIENIKGNRIGADINANAVNALRVIRDTPHELPKTNLDFTESDYKNENHKHFCVLGFAVSFGAKWKGGYSRNKRGDDYVNQAYNSAQRQSKKLKGASFVHSSYKDLHIPKNSVIYCDPPYESTTGYAGNFNHAEFWEWCRVKTKEGYKVFVSEYNAPDDFECVFEYSTITQVDNHNTGKSNKTERLFTYLHP